MVCLNSQPGVSRYFFGDRWQFAIECEVQDDVLAPYGQAGEPFGSLWLWLGGRVVGNPEAEELLAIGAWVARTVIHFDGQRPSDLLAALTNREKLDLVCASRFVDPKDSLQDRWKPYLSENLARYELITRDCSPAFDGWEALAIETEADEVILWRHIDYGNEAELTFPRGTLRSVAERFCAWLAQLTQERANASRTDA